VGTEQAERNYQGKRVCVFAQGLPGGGAERALVNLMRAFVRLGIDVDLLLTHRVGDYLAQLPPEVNVIDFGTRIPRSSVGVLVAYLKSTRPDALISAIANANVVAIVSRWIAGVPTRVGVGVHNTLSQRLHEHKSLRKRILVKSIGWFYPRADLIACCSGGVADDLADVTHIPRSKLDVIYNPVVTDELFAKAKEPVDHPWLADGQPPVILSVGRLSPEKDQLMLVDAFAKLRARRSCRLMIVGKGPEQDKIEARISKLGIAGDVALPGFTSNPYAYMAKAAVLALSSRTEGLPTALIEAIACGTQVVATDCKSGPREILDGGKYGRLVPVGDADAFADALDEALDSDTPPPAEAWRPYTDTASAQRFCEALLG
jgi:glycosyltransferase involved in cell wall biosynthesis